MAEHELGDGPLQQEIESNMRVLAQFLDFQFNGEENVIAGRRQWGFVVMLFPFNEAFSGRCNYISNGADRKDIVVLMKEMIARFEGQPRTEGNA